MSGVFFSNYSILFLRQSLSPAHLDWLASEPQDSSVSASRIAGAAMPGFLNAGSGGLNPGPCAFSAGALPSQLSPQP